MRRLALFLALAAAGFLTRGFAADLAIVVNKASSLDNLSSAELTKYFKADKSKAPDGTKVVIVMQAPGRAERAAALKGIYKMSESEYSDYFVEATFTGAVAEAPRALADGAAVKSFVAGNAGGLGYIAASEADDSVKVLKVDGKAPGDAGYKLSL